MSEGIMGRAIRKKQDSTDQVKVWVKSILPSQITDVQVKLRGRQLHIICEALHCPSMSEIAEQFSQSFHPQSLVTKLGSEYSADLQIFLCGRAKGHRRPDWTLKLDSQGQSTYKLPRLGDNFLELGDRPILNTLTVSESAQLSSAQLSSTKTIEGAAVLQDIQNNLSTTINLRAFNGLEKDEVSRSVVDLHGHDTDLIDNNIDNNTVGQNTINKKALSGNPVNPGNSDNPGGHSSINLFNSSLGRTVPNLFNQSSHSDQLEGISDNTNDNINYNINYNTNDNINGLIIPNNLTSNLNTAHDFSTAGNSIVSVIETGNINVIGIDSNSIDTSDHNTSSSTIIAQTLNDILAGLGVIVRVSIVPISQSSRSSQQAKNTENNSSQTVSAHPKKRLIIQCEASYNPDPSLLAEPITQKLRELHLKDCRDAVITMQVRGETTPDWSLKIDLTPPDLLLREWARWGDVIAIERILQKQLATLGIEIRATLKESTLHLFCSNTPNSDPHHQQDTLQAIAKILQKICPQGIKAATIYGCTHHDLEQTNQSVIPLWIDWLDLKQADKPELQLSVKQLAENGHQNALGFLLNRLLNPDLDRKLQTGGIRVLLLVKNAILHIMTEAPTCPSQSQVAPPIIKFLQQCNLPHVSYVRIYGRRAGQKQTIWRTGFDYDKNIQNNIQNNIDRENISEFNISPQELLSLSSQPIGMSDSPLVLTNGNNISDFINTERFESGFNQIFRQLLINTGLCSPADQEFASQCQPWVAVLAIATGLFTTFSIDQLGGVLLADARKNPAPLCEGIDCPGQDGENDSSNHLFTGLMTNSRKNQEFTASKFTNSDTDITELLSKLYPSFRSPQLDEQLLRYQKYLLEYKRPPDILIVGSSRALRGIDPEILEGRLRQTGHSDLRVYNLGINGATMQVVDLIVRQVLTPSQLPKLIIVADGVRALNSGRTDLTYDIIASSEGYQQAINNHSLITKETGIIDNNSDDNSDNNSHNNIGKNNSSQQTNNLVSIIQGKLENISALYPHREILKKQLLTAINTPPENLPEISAQANASDSVNNQLDNSAVDNFDSPSDFTNQGFLPITAKFEPVAYYQSHPLVSGYYDRDYENFQLLGKQTDALKNLLEYTAKSNVKVLFVNMPLTHEYLDQVRTAYEQEFIAYMHQLSGQYQHLTFQNLGASFLHDYDKFSDPSHLNKFGAIAVAESLANSPDITWRKLFIPKPINHQPTNHR